MKTKIALLLAVIIALLVITPAKADTQIVTNTVHTYSLFHLWPTTTHVTATTNTITQVNVSKTLHSFSLFHVNKTVSNVAGTVDNAPISSTAPAAAPTSHGFVYFTLRAVLLLILATAIIVGLIEGYRYRKQLATAYTVDKLLFEAFIAKLHGQIKDAGVNMRIDVSNLTSSVVNVEAIVKKDAVVVEHWFVAIIKWVKGLFTKKAAPTAPAVTPTTPAK